MALNPYTASEADARHGWRDKSSTTLPHPHIRNPPQPPPSASPHRLWFSVVSSGVFSMGNCCRKPSAATPDTEDLPLLSPAAAGDGTTSAAGHSPASQPLSSSPASAVYQPPSDTLMPLLSSKLSAAAGKAPNRAGGVLHSPRSAVSGASHGTKSALSPSGLDPIVALASSPFILPHRRLSMASRRSGRWQSDMSEGGDDWDMESLATEDGAPWV